VPTILHIDGHGDSRRIYGTILQHHGYRTLEAADAVAGSRLMQEHAPDVIVLSAFLPRIDRGVLRAWPLADGASARATVLLLTAHPLAEAERALLAGRCHAYLVKPCAPSELLAEIERLLHRRRLEA
jgi:DNA-binding response OmpR family regulator